MVLGLYLAGMLDWVGERLATRAALAAALATALGVLAPFLLLGAPAESANMVLAVFVVVVPLVAIATGYWVDELIGSRMRQLTAFLEEQSRASSAHLRRLPSLGTDEIGVAADAANRLLSHFTNVHVSMIDQTLELREAQEELALKEEVEKKSRELEARLKERAVLFEVLQESTRRPDLDKMLAHVVDRLGSVLRLRELAIMVRENDELVIRAAHGFGNGQMRMAQEYEQ